jgi:Flp pilus assembly protein TadD
MSSCKCVLVAGFLFVTLFPVSLLSGQSQTLTPADATALAQQGKFAEAEQAWRAILQRHPNDAGAYASLGFVLSREQKYPEAASAYRKAIALDPHLPGVQLNLGLAEFKQGKLEAAIPPLRSAIAADPQNLQATTLLGLSYYGAKHFEDAVKYLQILTRATKSCTKLWHKAACRPKITLALCRNLENSRNSIPSLLPFTC